MHTWLKLILAVSLLLGVLAGAPRGLAPASAGHVDGTCTGHRGCDTSSPPVTIDEDGFNGDIATQYEILNNGGSGGEPPSCTWWPGGTDMDGSGPSSINENPDEEPRHDGEVRWVIREDDGVPWRGADGTAEGTYYFYYCYHPDMDTVNEHGQQRQPPNIEGNCGVTDDLGSVDYVCYFDAINPDNLALLMVDQFRRSLARPVPQFSPEGTTLVNFDTWLWVEGDIRTEANPISESMSVPGQSVNASAWVSGVEWDMGDGETKHCPVTTDQDSAERDCSYQYERSSAGHGHDGETFEGSAAVVWTVTYEGNFGSTPISDDGNLSVGFEEPFEIRVAESQAVVVHD